MDSPNLNPNSRPTSAAASNTIRAASVKPPRPHLPPVPPSQLPQNVAPTKMSRGLQIGSFALATALTGYAVLFYDFGQREHCFMPVRRWFDKHTQGFFTLSERDRHFLAAQADTSNSASSTTPLVEGKLRTTQTGVVPDRRTPVQFFKDERNQDEQQRKLV
ncbi:hypothetical protein OIO90_003709 [Microbotryomycetes sp. JL221]|nr:hypothetical protein OIO90_003709 [Microbotryomycetes sp. JL221]